MSYSVATDADKVVVTSTDNEAYEVAREAFLYAYPLVLQYLTIRQATNFAEPTLTVGHCPINQFSHARSFPSAEYKSVIRGNVDTLFSLAHVDLGEEPIVLSIPAVDRFFVLPLISLWTDVFAAPGTRTTGSNSARDFLLVGPRWRGKAVGGLDVIRSPTRFVSIGGCTQTNGSKDYSNVHRIQRRYFLTPLSEWGAEEYTPPAGCVDATIDMKTLPTLQIERMDARTFFASFADLLHDNPPGPLDYPIMHRLERVGLHRGHRFDLNRAPTHIRLAFEQATLDAKRALTTLAGKARGDHCRDWVYAVNGGAYGIDYRQRAAHACSKLGGMLPQDCVSPSLAVDCDGHPLDGNHNYLVHFDRRELPPVDAFWSITAYDASGYFIFNALQRQALGGRDQLAVNLDGSVD